DRQDETRGPRPRQGELEPDAEERVDGASDDARGTLDLGVRDVPRPTVEWPCEGPLGPCVDRSEGAWSVEVIRERSADLGEQLESRWAAVARDGAAPQLEPGLPRSEVLRRPLP